MATTYRVVTDTEIIAQRLSYREACRVARATVSVQRSAAAYAPPAYALDACYTAWTAGDPDSAECAAVVAE